MANSARRKLDSSGRTFMPMNMDIGDNDEFMSLPKVLVVFGIVASYVIWILWGKNIGLNLFGWLFTFVLLTFIDQLLLRYIVFQERYYYKIWKRDSMYGDPKASIFWNIASIRKTGMGDILVYSDMKLGCILELEKDTIIGRESDSMEKHFDAWSEFYKSLHQYGYKYVQMNIMEPAGKDVRLDELAEIAANSKNEGVRTVLEYSTGYMKEISRATLNEKDYILIYTPNINRMNSIIGDVMEIAGKLLDGAYATVRIMSANEVYQLPKEIWNVGYFDGIEAQMDVYKHSGYSIKSPFKITQLVRSDYSSTVVSDMAERRIIKASKLLDNNKISYADWNIDDAMAGKFENGNYSKIVSEDNNNDSVNNSKNVKSKTNAKTKVHSEKSNVIKKKEKKGPKPPKSGTKTKFGSKKKDDGLKLDESSLNEVIDEINNGDYDVDDNELF